jgi:hypothetical protein
MIPGDQFSASADRDTCNRSITKFRGGVTRRLPISVSPEELRQSVIFAARFEYQAQRFELVKDRSLWLGDPFALPLPKGVEPVMTPALRREYCRAVLPPTWSASQVDPYQTKHWCGAFTLFCLKQAGMAQTVFWKGGIGYVEPHRLPHVKVPPRPPVHHPSTLQQTAPRWREAFPANVLRRKPFRPSPCPPPSTTRGARRATTQHRWPLQRRLAEGRARARRYRVEL